MTVSGGGFPANANLTVFLARFDDSGGSGQPERFATRVAAPVQVFGLLFKPVVWVTTGLTDLFLWPFLGGKRLRERRLSRQELLVAIVEE